jgi:hypothetical protein
MPSKHDHLKCGSALLELLRERWSNFCPICEMEKMYHDVQTPPKLKKRLRRDIDTYTVLRVKPSSKGASSTSSSRS